METKVIGGRIPKNWYVAIKERIDAGEYKNWNEFVVAAAQKEMVERKIIVGVSE